MHFIHQYPYWYYLLCLLLGAGLSFLLYYKDRRLSDFSKALIYGLFTLRFLTLTVLAFLLFAPLLRYAEKQSEKPIYVVLTDNSQSMLIAQDSLSFTEELKARHKVLKEELAALGHLEHFSFGSRINDTNLVDFSNKVTNFQKAFEELELRYQNRNVAAYIIESDGIYNQGMDPQYLPLLNAPVYSVAYGDSSRQNDLILSEVINNKIAFLGNEFPVEFRLQNDMERGITTTVKVTKGKETLAEEKIEMKADQDVFSLRLNLPAEHIGLQRYVVSVEGIQGEYSLENNAKDFYIDVLDGRQYIQIVAKSPHPDVMALKAALQTKESFKVESFLLEDEPDFTQADLVILHQIPNDDLASRKYLQTIMAAKKAILFIVGTEGRPSHVKRFFPKLKFVSNSSGFNFSSAIWNPDFPLFQLEESEQELLADFPPLAAQGVYLEGPEQNLIAAYQKIGNVETEFPLLDFWDMEGQKVGWFYGEGLWRWRIANFKQEQNHRSFDQLLLKTVQYLALKADKSLFRFNHETSFYENQRIKLFAQLYNESYELITEPEVNLLLKDNEGKEFTYSMSKSEAGYFVNIESLPVGTYSYIAKTEVGAKTLTENGQFSVKALQFENLISRANHSMLYALSELSNGKLYYPSQYQDLIEEVKGIDAPKKIIETERYESLINLKTIFFILLFLISLEWFIRKREGAY